MFCPNCTSYLTEDDIIKKNAKYTPDDKIALEYTAYCPRCSVEMGKMSWGQFTPSPYLIMEVDPLKGRTFADSGGGSPAQAAAKPERHGKNVKRCPHCGLPLPDDY